MTDWREVGRKADAHLVRDLYRRAFSNDGKTIARQRTINALRSAGVTTVLDLWGGGISAEALVAAGFRVIAVEDGSMELTDPRGRIVSQERKRRALEYAAAEGGYEARFGKAEKFAAEADGAYLDFCGPWSRPARRAVTACRHMLAVAVTLTPDHDITTDATSMLERQMAYQLYLKMAWSEKPRWEFMNGAGGVRRLLDYRRSGGFGVFLYLLSRTWIKLPPMKLSDREKTRPDMHQRHLAIKRAWYHRKSPDEKRRYNSRKREHEAKKMADPEYRARHLMQFRHERHIQGGPKRPYRRLPCDLCEAA
jgi:hypothetical protein